jgi:hypothetical protein
MQRKKSTHLATMGYIRDWTDFAAKAEALVQAHPNKVRPVGAWRGAGGAVGRGVVPGCTTLAAVPEQRAVLWTTPLVA